MSQAKHTPGKWEVVNKDEDGVECFVITAEDPGKTPWYIARVYEAELPGIDYTAANANLIAAAPDLLENLEAILLNLKYFVKNHDYIPIVNAEAAIAKAKGGNNMTPDQKLKADQAAMPTAELLEWARHYISAVSKKGHREWRMSVPVSRDDADMVFQEVCRRLEIISKFYVSFNLVNNAQALLNELEETHAALCFTGDYVGSERYKRNKAAIEAAKGIQP